MPQTRNISTMTPQGKMLWQLLCHVLGLVTEVIKSSLRSDEYIEQAQKESSGQDDEEDRLIAQVETKKNKRTREIAEPFLAYDNRIIGNVVLSPSSDAVQTPIKSNMDDGGGSDFGSI